jgi:hypothetical protein
MRSISCLVAGLDALAADDVGALADGELRDQLLALLAAVNRLNAEVSRRVGAFDARGLPEGDACRTAASWLRAFGRLSGPAAGAQVKRARVLRALPELAAAAASGEVSVEHVNQVVRLADRVGAAHAAAAESALVAVASVASPERLATACQRVVVHVDPDGDQPDAHIDFQRRAITLSPFDGMVLVRGQLDPEGGAALATALDALMLPSGPDDSRSAAQRRADALAELARGALREGRTPTVGGVRPQIAVLLTSQALTGRRAAAIDGLPAAPEATALAHVAAGTDAPKLPAGPGPTPTDELADTSPAHLEWVGEIADLTAQRIACDADVWRVVLDPATSQPVNVGRAYRLVPHWIRKALHARDRGCRFPGCNAPVAWTDAHHLLPWAHGGATDVDNLILLCRYHHGIVHEGRWRISIHAGAVTVTRPEGRPYELNQPRAPGHAA